MNIQNYEPDTAYRHLRAQMEAEQIRTAFWKGRDTPTVQMVKHLCSAHGVTIIPCDILFNQEIMVSREIYDRVKGELEERERKETQPRTCANQLCRFKGLATPPETLCPGCRAQLAPLGLPN